jgi:hypothetical protein
VTLAAKTVATPLMHGLTTTNGIENPNGTENFKDAHAAVL